SGPAALRCSQFIVKEMHKTGAATVRPTIDLFPDRKETDVQDMLLERVTSEPRKAIKNVLKMWLPERFVPVLLKRSNVNEQAVCAEISKADREAIVAGCKAFEVNISGTLPLEKAFVTGGGVHLKEVDPRTMQSRLMPGLFFCGEVLDIHGY